MLHNIDVSRVVTTLLATYGAVFGLIFPYMVRTFQNGFITIHPGVFGLGFIVPYRWTVAYSATPENIDVAHHHRFDDQHSIATPPPTHSLRSDNPRSSPSPDRNNDQTQTLNPRQRIHLELSLNISSSPTKPSTRPPIPLTSGHWDIDLDPPGSSTSTGTGEEAAYDISWAENRWCRGHDPFRKGRYEHLGTRGKSSFTTTGMSADEGTSQQDNTTGGAQSQYDWSGLFVTGPDGSVYQLLALEQYFDLVEEQRRRLHSRFEQMMEDAKKQSGEQGESSAEREEGERLAEDEVAVEIMGRMRRGWAELRDMAMTLGVTGYITRVVGPYFAFAKSSRPIIAVGTAWRNLPRLNIGQQPPILGMVSTLDQLTPTIKTATSILGDFLRNDLARVIHQIYNYYATLITVLSFFFIGMAVGSRKDRHGNDGVHEAARTTARSSGGVVRAEDVERGRGVVLPPTYEMATASVR